MMWVTDASASLVYIDHGWEALSGQAVDKAHGRGWLSQVHADDRVLALDTWRGATALEAAFSIHCRLRRPEGGYRWVAARGSPSIVPHQSRFVGYLGQVDVLKGSGLARASARIAHQRSARASNVDRIADAVIAARSLALAAGEPTILAILDLALTEVGFRLAQTERIRRGDDGTA